MIIEHDFLDSARNSANDDVTDDTIWCHVCATEVSLKKKSYIGGVSKSVNLLVSP